MPLVRKYDSLSHLSHQFSKFFYSRAAFRTLIDADVIFNCNVFPFCYKCNSSLSCCTEGYKKRLISTTISRLKERSHLSSPLTCTKAGESESKNEFFLHVSPSGDFWFGTTIFAAKHLQPNYIKSIVIPDDKKFEGKLEDFLSNASMDVLHMIYDNGRLPDSFYCDLNPMEDSK